jgi:hypothetical protein
MNGVDALQLAFVPTMLQKLADLWKRVQHPQPLVDWITTPFNEEGAIECARQSIVAGNVWTDGYGLITESLRHTLGQPLVNGHITMEQALAAILLKEVPLEWPEVYVKEVGEILLELEAELAQ